MVKNRWGILILVALLLAGLAACGGDGSVVGPPVPSEAVGTSIDLAGSTSTVPEQVPSATLRPASATATAPPASGTQSTSPPSANPTREPATPSSLPTEMPSALDETPTSMAVVPTPTSRQVPTDTPGREPSPSSKVDPAPASVRVELQRIVSGLNAPVSIANAGDDSGRLFIVEKVGRIRIVSDGTLVEPAFLDMSSRVGSAASEQGLLGLAFDPKFESNGLLFVNYTNREGDTVIARFAASGDATRVDPSSEVILLTIKQPAGNHNGGHLAFGPDGNLYVGLGDGGGAGDQFGSGQNGETLLGTMLRLDVDSGQPYALPASNPFIAEPSVRDEIWSVGLRNPWRFSFDRLTGDLYIADVGQGQYEEIDFQAATSTGGQNYGWPVMEGVHCFPEEVDCDQTGLTLPVAEYDHSHGCSVTGGYVYRGQEFPMMKGIYVYGDYCSGRIWGLARTADGNWHSAQLARADVSPSSFGEDEAGELYMVDMRQGELFKIAARLR